MEAPARDPEVSSSQDVAELHLLIGEMDDELTAYRWREAVWISIVIHALACLALIFAPKWIPRSATFLPVTPLHGENTTFLELPKDQQKVKEPNKTDIISDKNRTAQSPTPLPQKELIRKLLDARERGRQSPPTPPPAPPQQAAQPQSPVQPSPQQQAGAENPIPTLEPPQTAQLQTPRVAKGPSPFKMPAPGIQQAIESMPANRGVKRITFGTARGGGFGVLHPNTTTYGDMEILSDTMGVDFSDYLQRLKYAIQTHWDELIPEGARGKHAKLSIQFAILKDGTIAGLQIVRSSGDLSLDRPAYGSITGSAPFDQLPTAFKGPYLAIRATFYYNPDPRTDGVE